MALYAKNKQETVVQCSLSIFHTPPALPPVVIMSNLWIFILTPTMQGSSISMIFPDKVTSSSLFQQPLHILKLPPACSATSRHFHLHLHYEDHMVAMHVSLHKANFNIFNVSTPDFCIWQQFDSNWTHMQKLVDISEVPITQLYKHVIGQSEPILQFDINRDMEDGPSLTWKLLTHPETYIGAISVIFVACICFYCLKRFWCRPVTPRCKSYSLVSS